MAHIIQGTQNNSNTLRSASRFFRVITESITTSLYSAVLIYKRYKTRQELSELPMSIREDVGLSYDEIDRIVKSIK